MTTVLEKKICKTRNNTKEHDVWVQHINKTLHWPGVLFFFLSDVALLNHMGSFRIHNTQGTDC